MDSLDRFIDSIRSYLNKWLVPPEDLNQATPSIADENIIQNSEVVQPDLGSIARAAEAASQNLLKLEREIDLAQEDRELAKTYSIFADCRNQIMIMAGRTYYWQIATRDLDVDLDKFKTISLFLTLQKDIIYARYKKIARSRHLWKEQLTVARSNRDKSAIEEAQNSIEICSNLLVRIDRDMSNISRQLDTLRKVIESTCAFRSLVCDRGAILQSVYQDLARQLQIDLAAEEGLNSKRK
jgi:hypothetical protein